MNRPSEILMDIKSVKSWMEEADYVPVVRCEKCKYGITAHGISNGWVLCSKPYIERGNAMHRNDWFCADGKEKSDE